MKKRIFGQFLILALIFTTGSLARAGIFEVGSSASYRRSNIGENAYDESRSVTGSVSYYLNEASAIELSYTYGENKRSVSENEANGHTASMFYSTMGLDFVYTIGSREAFLRPYVKAGANYILQKRLVDQYRGPDGTLFSPTITEDDPGLVPSAGVGFRLALTQSLSLKVGVDAWTSRPTNREPVTVDYAARAGLSLML